MVKKKQKVTCMIRVTLKLLRVPFCCIVIDDDDIFVIIIMIIFMHISYFLYNVFFSQYSNSYRV